MNKETLKTSRISYTRRASSQEICTRSTSTLEAAARRTTSPETHALRTTSHICIAFCAIFVAVALSLICTNTNIAFAKSYTDTPSQAPDYYASSVQYTYVLDHYGLLSSTEAAQLDSQAQSMSKEVGVGVYLLIVDDIGYSSARQYAKDYYMGNNLGYENSTSGILFLIAVDSRDYVTITYNKGLDVFTDYTISNIENAVVECLSNDNWEEGCQAYYDTAEHAVNFYTENGYALDVDTDPEAASEKMSTVLGVAVIIGLIVAAIICLTWYRQMKTAQLKTEASDFFDQGSLNIYERNDRYITTTRSVVKVESENKGGGGGSWSDSGGFGGSSGGKF
jgi:uncharacterized protein